MADRVRQAPPTETSLPTIDALVQSGDAEEQVDRSRSVEHTVDCGCSDCTTGSSEASDAEPSVGAEPEVEVTPPGESCGAGEAVSQAVEFVTSGFDERPSCTLAWIVVWAGGLTLLHQLTGGSR